MDKIRVVLQNNKEFVTEIENYNALELTNAINNSESSIVQIGDMVINRHHIECIIKVSE